MSRILKYRLQPETDEVAGHVVAVAWQHGEVTVWCEVADPPEPVHICILPTGAPVPDDERHVGAAVSDHLVFHVYERP